MLLSNNWSGISQTRNGQVNSQILISRQRELFNSYFINSENYLVGNLGFFSFLALYQLYNLSISSLRFPISAILEANSNWASIDLYSLISFILLLFLKGIMADRHVIQIMCRRDGKEFKTSLPWKGSYIKRRTFKRLKGLLIQ